MSKISLATITNAQNLSNLNDNFAKLADSLNNGTLWRANPVGEPNQMTNDLDMNNYSILNAYHISAITITVGGSDITTIVGDASDAAIAAANSAQTAASEAAAANASATAASNSATAASSVLASSLLKANNLNDVTNAATARTNLGLGNVNNTSDANKPISTAQAAVNAAKLDVNNPSATGKLTVTATADTVTVDLNGTAATSQGASVQFRGPGASNPNKIVRVNGGVLQVVNSANTQVISTLDDSGNFSASGYAGKVSGAQASGYIGESIVASVTAQTIANGTNTNVTSISLPAGIWDVSGVVRWIASAGVTNTAFIQGISTVSATRQGGQETVYQFSSTNLTQVFPTPVVPLTLTSTTTIYLVANAVFSGGTQTYDAYIRARRVG